MVIEGKKSGIIIENSNKDTKFKNFFGGKAAGLLLSNSRDQKIKKVPACRDFIIKGKKLFHCRFDLFNCNRNTLKQINITGFGDPYIIFNTDAPLFFFKIYPGLYGK